MVHANSSVLIIQNLIKSEDNKQKRGNCLLNIPNVNLCGKDKLWSSIDNLLICCNKTQVQASGIDCPGKLAQVEKIFLPKKFT